MGELSRRALKIVESGWFTATIIGIILLNTILVGLDTSSWIHEQFGNEIELTYDVILWIFIVEALLKMLSKYPRPWAYFRDGWNTFDFVIIVVCLIPSAGPLAMVARIARLLRVFRLISVFPQLRTLVTALINSLPGMLNVVILMSVIFYTYGIAGFHLFHEIDSTHWRDLGTSLLSLFRIVTLEDWTDIMYVALDHYWWAWIYFVSFVILATFVIINLFIGIVVTNVQEARELQLAELQHDPGRQEVIEELRRTQTALKKVQEHLAKQDAR